jgi:hypothetical protein
LLSATIKDSTWSERDASTVHGTFRRAEVKRATTGNDIGSARPGGQDEKCRVRLDGN